MHAQTLRLNAICNYINQHIGEFAPKVGVILGSGLGAIANELKQPIILPYSDIPNFPVSRVPGHNGQLIFGYLGDVSVVCMQGRVHRYEGATDEDFRVTIRALKKLGCHTLLVTNASGSLRDDIGPGELVLINDHINFQHISPLIGPNDDECGPRFLPMDNVYHPKLRVALIKSAQKLALHLHEGVNMSVMGPCYETPAEIRAYRLLGADVINMSTIPEVIVAHHCGLHIAAIAVITNFASGISHHIHHDLVLEHAKQACNRLGQLFKTLLKDYQDQLGHWQHL